jgi:hypothetical protein
MGDRDDLPVTLKVACEVVYENAITPYTLLAEARRGNIKINKVGKKWFTTLREAKELKDRCPGVQEAPASISTPRASNGQSETVDPSFARAALRTSVQQRKSALRNTSVQNTHRRQHQRP